MKIWEIDRAISEAIENAIDLETGEIIDAALSDEIDNLKNERNNKFVNIACYIKNQQLKDEGFKSAIESMRRRREIEINKTESLKKYLALSIGQGVKLTDPRADISWRKSTECIIGVDPRGLMPQYQRVKTIIEADKKRIAEAIKSGDQVPGCYLQDNQNLIIK